MTENTDSLRRAALGAVLETAGSDPARWPAGAAERFAALVERDPEARRMIAEAAALDRLLDETRAFEDQRAPSTGLAGRILRQVPKRAVPDAKVIVPIAAASTRNASRRTPAPLRRVSGHNRGTWASAAVLAASLVIGLVGGAILAEQPAFHDATQRLGVAQLIGVDQAGADEEDVL